MSSQKRIAIVGMGFAGCAVFNNLKKHPEFKQGNLSIDIYEPREAFEYTPALHEALGKIAYKKLLKNFEKVSSHKNVQVFKEKVEDIKELLQGEVIYDAIAVTTGSGPRFFGETFKENTYPVKSLKDVKAINEEISKKKNEAIAIIGGGYVGVEVASVLVEEYPYKQIVIIHGKDRLLDTLPEKASRLSEKFLDYYGADYHYEVYANSINKKEGKGYEVILSNEKVVNADMVILAAGIQPNDDVLYGGCEADKYLRWDEDQKVFIAGDVVKTHRIETAHNALVEGAIVGQNILASLYGGNMKCHDHEKGDKTPLLVALGMSDGFMVVGDLVINLPRITGFMKRMIQWVMMRGLL